MADTTDTQATVTEVEAPEQEQLSGDQLDVVRDRIATKLGLSTDDVDLLVTATTRTGVFEQMARLAEITKPKPRIPRPDPSQGARGTSPNMGTPAQVFERFLKSQLKG